MPLDAFVAFLQREGKLHPVCRSNLAIHGILATVNLVVYLAMIPTIESERFSCHTGTSKTASLVQEECFEYYKRDITKNFPLFALILVTVLPVMVLSVLNCTNFKESSEGSNSYGHRWCKISVFYVGALSLRFLILATFVVLQWSYFYPIWFPDAYNCFIPLASQPPISGLNYTTLTNGTVSNCKDKLSDKKSAVSILVFTAHCLALLLTLVEIVILGRKAHAQAGESESFWDNKTFCEVFLGLQGEDKLYAFELFSFFGCSLVAAVKVFVEKVWKYILQFAGDVKAIECQNYFQMQQTSQKRCNLTLSLRGAVATPPPLSDFPACRFCFFARIAIWSIYPPFVLLPMYL